MFDKDEHNRPETTLESLAKLKPAFRPGRHHHRRQRAGPEQRRRRDDRRRRGLGRDARACSRWPGWSPTASPRSSRACSASAPCRPSARRWSAPAGRSATSSASRSTRLSPPSPSRSLRELGLPEDIVNVEGGAIAHGHPIGATGAVLTTRLLHSMRRDGLRRGIVTLCIGGGQGIALALESMR